MKFKPLLRLVKSAFQRANLYYGHGTTCAMDEAYWLLVRSLGYDFNDLTEDFNPQLNLDQRKTVMALCIRRIEERIPLAYLLNEAYFADLRFYVDKRVLIPRSPLAELIEAGFVPWLDPNKVTRALDLCCGSGCIGLALKHYLPDTEVVLSDISPAALEVAAENIKRQHHTVTLCQSDLFNTLSGQFDLIISNPPYVDADDLAMMPAEYHHEPRLGLAGGEDGLQLVHRILNEAGAFLKEGGALIVEVGNSMPALIKAYPTLPFTWLEFEQGGEGVFLLYKEDLPCALP